MKGRIVKIEKYQSRVTYIKQGVKGSDQYKYDNYSGGNGHMLRVASIWALY